jgi:hypothetical protein
MIRPRSSDPAQFLAEIMAWDTALKVRNINPGTSADLTVATLFAHRLTNILPAARNNGSLRTAGTNSAAIWLTGPAAGRTLTTRIAILPNAAGRRPRADMSCISLGGVGDGKGDQALYR